jgi:hypothetical protein
MRVISLSRTVAAFAVLLLAGACNDTTGPIEVPALPPEGMTVEPRNATIQAGQALLLKATLIDEHGDRLDGAGISWKSTNDAVATVSATGEVFGRGAGHAVITASALGKSQFSTIRVSARPPKPAFDPDKPGSKGAKKVKPNMMSAQRKNR